MLALTSLTSRARAASATSALTAFFAIVVGVAGASAVALLAFPGSTERYFSWTLRPTAGAALIGGLYLTASAVFAWALTRPRDEVRTLTVGVLGLTVPTLAFTVAHRDVFDLGRWQAVGWWALFAVAPLVVARDLRAGRPARPADVAAPLRLVGAAVSACSAVVAVAVWVTGATLTIRYLGCWASFVAVATGHAARSGRRSDAKVALAVVAAVAAGAAAGGLRLLVA